MRKGMQLVQGLTNDATQKANEEKPVNNNND